MSMIMIFVRTRATTAGLSDNHAWHIVRNARVAVCANSPQSLMHAVTAQAFACDLHLAIE